MPVKNINKKVDVNSRWLQKRGENFRREQELPERRRRVHALAGDGTGNDCGRKRIFAAGRKPGAT